MAKILTVADSLKGLYAKLGGTPEDVEDTSTVTEMIQEITEVAGSGSGGGGGAFKLTVGGTIADPTFDKTGDEVIAAMKKGQPVIVAIPTKLIDSNADDGFMECQATSVIYDSYNPQLCIFERTTSASMPFNKIECFEWSFTMWPSSEEDGEVYPSQIMAGVFHKYTIAVTAIS